MIRKQLIALGLFTVLIGCTHFGSNPDKRSPEAKAYTKHLSSKSVNVYSASKACPKTVEKVDKQDWPRLVELANACVAEQKFKKTEELAQILATKHYLGPWGAYFYSVVAESRGQTMRALWMANLALQKAPEQGLLSFQKARLLWQQNQVSEAVSLFKQALEQDSSLVDAHMILGQIYYRDSDFKEARNHFAEVIKKDQKRPDAFIGLAECELEMGSPEAAVMHFEKAISMRPKALDLRLRQARIYENILEQAALALEKYKEIYRLGKSKSLDQPVSKKVAEAIKQLESKLSQAEPGEKVSKRNPAEEEATK